MKRLEKTNEYDKWARTLTDRTVAARVQVRIDRLLDGNAGDVASVGEGVSELRRTLVQVGACTLPSVMAQ